MSARLAGSLVNPSRFAVRDVVVDDAHVSCLILSTKLRKTIVHYLRQCLPHEGVGLLATDQTGSSLTAVRFYPGRNIDRSPRRFTMDPADVVPALADMK